MDDKIIKMNELSLCCFDKDNKEHVLFLRKLLDDSSIKQRFQGLLLNLMSSDSFFGKGFLLCDSDLLIGYIDISEPDLENCIYLRGAIMNDFRGMKYGGKMLREVTDYIFTNSSEVDMIKLRIKEDNLSSLGTACSCGYKWINDDYYGCYNYNKKHRK